ncbi:sigma factor [Luedemannella flava]
MGPADAGDERLSARSAACRASTSSRRTTSGSSRSVPGASAPASSDAHHDGRPAEHRVGTAGLEAVWRIESARIIGALTRFTGDFGLAEDVAQEAVAEALVAWARDGAPTNQVGWLLATARRRAIDAFRRRTALDQRYAIMAGQLAEGEATSGRPRHQPTTCRGTRSGSTTTSSR